MTDRDRRLQWWREARFGMFIHWGLYALPAGQWKGERIPGLGEWIMWHAKIPPEEYEQLAAQFNPVQFDADAWAALAARAGMKYLVITAKHHDGFAMFDSACSEYDIVDATPYAHDVMADLSEACAKHGLELCFYYSQSQDWHAPGGAGHWQRGDKWYHDQPDPEAFAHYLDVKAEPQVREILTQYGPLGLIWFDTPVCITPEQSRRFAALVHELQPDCLVNGRVGHDLGDYRSLGDNQIPRGPVEGDWETPATLNDTWGFRSDDHNWKSVEELLHLLVDLASKGVNYLLNVGPTAEGLIPPESVERLEAIGRWMDVNGEAIHGSGPNPWPWEFEWGRVTTKPGRLYLHLYEWPSELRLNGLRSTVTGARLLAEPAQALELEQSGDGLTLKLPASRPDPIVSVIEVAYADELDVDTTPAAQASGMIQLPGYLADRTKAPEATVGRAGVVADWHQAGSSLSWTLRTDQPGAWRVAVLQVSASRREPPSGQQVTLKVGDQVVSGVLDNARPVPSPRALHFPECASDLGTIHVAAPGVVRCELTLDDAGPAGKAGVALSAVELRPA
jgi:alpha-L-fucosidase